MKQFFKNLLFSFLRWALNGVLRVYGFFLGDQPENANGASLDPDLHALIAAQGPFDPERLMKYGFDRGRFIASVGMRITGPPAVNLPFVEDRTIDGPKQQIQIRIYDPDPGTKLPGCVFYHGGGFVLGDLESHDGFCRLLARNANRRVIAVDYRRAPEHRFPAAVEDAVASFRWTHEHAQKLNIDQNRLAVAGDSAGGNLATVVCQHQIKEDLSRPSRQLLIYPLTDMVEDYPSRHQRNEQLLLPWRGAEWFGEQYLSDDVDVSLEDHRISPLRFDQLETMPPTLLATAGFDPLRDEGIAYVDRLKSNDVAVRHHHYDQLVHGFITYGGVSERARKATRELAREI